MEVDTAEKGRRECISEFDVAYVGQVEGAALHWLLIVESFSMTAAAEIWQWSLQSENHDSMCLQEGMYRAIVCCVLFQGCLRRGTLGTPLVLTCLLQLIW